jgi:hypothetical protein
MASSLNASLQEGALRAALGAECADVRCCRNDDVHQCSQQLCIAQSFCTQQLQLQPAGCMVPAGSLPGCKQCMPHLRQELNLSNCSHIDGS